VCAVTNLAPEIGFPRRGARDFIRRLHVRGGIAAAEQPIDRLPIVRQLGTRADLRVKRGLRFGSQVARLGVDVGGSLQRRIFFDELLLEAGQLRILEQRPPIAAR
jgi:hypothetical protein